MYKRQRREELAVLTAKKALEFASGSKYDKELASYVHSNRHLLEQRVNNSSQDSAEQQAVNVYKNQIKQQEERDDNNAQNLYHNAENLMNDLKTDYHECYYDTTRDIFRAAEKELEEAEFYLSRDPERSSQYSENALKKFSELEKIIADNDNYWDSLEEKYNKLSYDLLYNCPIVVNEEQGILKDKAADLSNDAYNILKGATGFEGGYPSRRNLDMANRKIIEAQNLIEKIKSMEE